MYHINNFVSKKFENPTCVKRQQDCMLNNKRIKIIADVQHQEGEPLIQCKFVVELITKFENETYKTVYNIAFVNSER